MNKYPLRVSTIFVFFVVFKLNLAVFTLIQMEFMADKDFVSSAVPPVEDEESYVAMCTVDIKLMEEDQETFQVVNTIVLTQTDDSLEITSQSGTFEPFTFPVTLLHSVKTNVQFRYENPTSVQEDKVAYSQVINNYYLNCNKSVTMHSKVAEVHKLMYPVTNVQMIITEHPMVQEMPQGGFFDFLLSMQTPQESNLQLLFMI